MYANQIINRFMDFDANRIIEHLQSLLNSDCHCFCFSIINNKIFNQSDTNAPTNIHTMQDLETKVHDGTDLWTADMHPVSRLEWRSNLRTVLSLLDEHDERHRPPIQGIDIRPLATPACRGRRASYMERNGLRYTARLQVLITLRRCDRSAPFATGHEFVGVSSRRS